MKSTFRYALCGALAGFVNGLFGGGGGLVFIPLVTRLTDIETKKAFSTCVAVILPITIASVVVYISNKGVSALPAIEYMIGATIGGLLAGKLFVKVPTKFLKRALALFIIYGGVRYLL